MRYEFHYLFKNPSIYTWMDSHNLKISTDLLKEKLKIHTFNSNRNIDLNEQLK